MGKPTEQELKQALIEAARMRENSEDPDHVAKALLNSNYRMKYLEDVLHAAERYLHSGLGTTEHLKLVSAIKTYHELDLRSAGEEEQNFDL